MCGLGRHWVLGSDGRPRTTEFKGSPRGSGWIPYGKTDKGGGASKINWSFKKGDKRIRLWKRKPSEETKIVRYTRSIILEKGKKGTPESLIDVVIEDREPVDMSDLQMSKKLASKGMEKRMLRFLSKGLTAPGMDKKFGRDFYKYQYGGMEFDVGNGGYEIMMSWTGSFLDDFREFN